MSLSRFSTFSQQNLTTPNSCDSYTYAFENFRLDAARLMLYRGEETISLKPKVIETLVALVERHGEVVGKSELMGRLWADSFVEESNLTQNIYLIRKTLGKTLDGRPFIETFARRGYRFNGEIRDRGGGAELFVATRTTSQTVIQDETIEKEENRTPKRPIIGATAVFILLAISASAFLYLRNKSNQAAAPFANFKLKRFSDRGDIKIAAVSRDGKLIAYSDAKNAIWLKNTATADNVKVLPETETETAVVGISPDNNYIYLSRNFKDRKNEIQKLSIFGGAFQQKVTQDSWSDLALSPDGKQISFIRGDDRDNRSLIVANTDGTGEREIAANSPGEPKFGMWSQSIAWSPDGSRLACTVENPPDGNEIWNIKILSVADGREISLIRPDPGWRWIDAVAWLPDGDNLLVIGVDRSSVGQIYSYTIPTGKWRRVTNDLSSYIKLLLTEDGKTLITFEDDISGNLWLLPSGGDAKQAKQITFGRNLLTDVSGLSWTPDGKIVYATNTSGRWEIWRVDADGANQRQLTHNCAENDSCCQPAASPDGRYIIFQATRDGVANIWRMDADGGNPTRLTTSGGSYPTITPDGRFVIYSDQTPSATLRQVRIEGGDPVRFNGLSTALAASISPDGRSLVFGYFDKAAKIPRTCVAPIGADAPEKCYEMSRSFPRWAGNGSFYYLDHDYKGIWKQPLGGEREFVLGFPGERTNNFAFSPDGRRLVVARSKKTTEIVALVDER